MLTWSTRPAYANHVDQHTNPYYIVYNPEVSYGPLIYEVCTSECEHFLLLVHILLLLFNHSEF